MTSSPTHLPTPPSFFWPSPHPPLPLFFLLALPTLPEPLPTLSDDFSMMTSSSENMVASIPWRQPNELFADWWCHPMILTANQKPPFSEDFFRRLPEDNLHQSEARKIFGKYGRKCPTVLLWYLGYFAVMCPDCCITKVSSRRVSGGFTSCSAMSCTWKPKACLISLHNNANP